VEVTAELAAQEAAQADLVLHAGWLRRLGYPLVWTLIGTAGAALAIGGGLPEALPWCIGVPAVLGGWQTWAAWRWRAELGNESVRVRGPFGSRTLAFDEIDSITFDAERWTAFVLLPAGRRSVLRLRGPRGGVSLHAGYARFDKHLPRILEGVCDLLAERFARSLAAGRPVPLSRRLTVDREGLEVRGRLWGRRRIAWSRLELLFEEGLCTISDAGRRVAVFSVADTANLLVLPRLVSLVTGELPSGAPTVTEVSADGPAGEPVAEPVDVAALVAAEQQRRAEVALLNAVESSRRPTAMEAVSAAAEARETGVSVRISPAAAAAAELHDAVSWMEAAAADKPGDKGG